MNVLFDGLFPKQGDRERIFLDIPAGRRWRYGDFLDCAGSTANALCEAGVTAGDRVVAQVAKSPQALALYAACVGVGAIFIPLNTAYTVSELTYFVADAGPRLLVCDPASADALRPVAEMAGAGLLTLGAEGDGTLAELAARQPARFQPADRGAEDLAAILYTSGTTGRSKGAMLTHANLLSNAKTLVESWRFTEQDVLLHALPIFHTHGLFVACNVTLLAGGSLIFLPAFNLDDVIAALPQASAMMGIPTFYTRLLADPRFDRSLVAHMRLFTCGSAPLLPEVFAEFAARTGLHILERYGMTETNMTTSNPYDGERRGGTVGFPLTNVALRICDDSGFPVKQGEVGVIEVRGPNVFKGYWNMPEKTELEFRPDGFFITGDVARIDDDGYVHIVGRAKDMIISGGYNVYPREVEAALDALAGIEESAAFGVPHPDFGEAVVAAFVAKPGVLVDEGAVIKALAGTIARFKQPKKLFQVEQLPRNTMGKVQKAELRSRFAGLFAGQA